MDFLHGGDVERDDGYSSKRRYSEGGSTGRLVRLSRRDGRAVTESTTIISAWGDTIDIMIRTRREAIKRGCGGDGARVVGGAYTTDPLRALKI